MKNLAIVLFLSLSVYLLPAQERCGNEFLLEHLSSNPDYIRALDESNRLIAAATISQRNDGEEILTIPVVVHVLHLGEPVGTGSNISDQQVFDAIRGANERWRLIRGDGVDMGVEFCPASKDPDGNPSNGIVRVDARNIPGYEEYGISYLGSEGGDELRLKNLSNWPHTYVYNIWVVHEIPGNWAGFALFPYSFQYAADGTVVHAAYMTYNNSTLAHELGHGMALFHTFQGDAEGCPSNANCTFQGDWVCDTPPHRQNDCSTSPCSVSDSMYLSYRNYMSYCGNKTLFTQGQKDRVRTAITTLSRKKLLTSAACNTACAEVHIAADAYTCDAESAGVEMDTLRSSTGCDTILTTTTIFIPPAEADFSYSTGSNGIVVFTNSSVNSVSYDWDFGDGSTSTAPNPDHVYISEGAYTVQLISSNICVSDTVSYELEIILTGKKDEHTAPALLVFPNPVNGIFTIELPAGYQEANEIRLVNTLGQSLANYPVSPLSNKVRFTGYLPPGIYYLSLLCNDKQLSISRIAVQ